MYKIEKTGNFWFAINTTTGKAEKSAIYKRGIIDFINTQATILKQREIKL